MNPMKLEDRRRLINEMGMPYAIVFTSRDGNEKRVFKKLKLKFEN